MATPNEAESFVALNEFLQEIFSGPEREGFYRRIRKKINTLERCCPAVYYKCQWEQGKETGASLGYTIYRWLHLFLLLAALLLSLLSKDDGQPGRWPIFFPNWALFLYVIQATLAAGIVTAAFLATVKGKPVKDSTKLFEMYGALHSTSTVLAFSVTVIYWSIVYDSQTHHLDLANLSKHALNSVIMLVDLAVVAQPVQVKNIIFPLLFTFVYIIFNVIYYLCGGTDRKGNHYIYELLHWDTPINAGLFTLGGCFLSVVLFIIVWFLTILRQKIANKLKSSPYEMAPLPFIGQPFRLTDRIFL